MGMLHGGGVDVHRLNTERPGEVPWRESGECDTAVSVNRVGISAFYRSDDVVLDERLRLAEDLEVLGGDEDVLAVGQGEFAGSARG